LQYFATQRNHHILSKANVRTVRHTICLVLFLSLIPMFAEAQLFRNSNHWKQYRNEWSLAIGTTGFLGELGGRNRAGSDLFWDLEFNQSHLAAAGYYRYFITEKTAITGSFSYGVLRGSDETTAEKFRRNRNLNFKSNVYELAVRYEFHLAQELIGHRYNLRGAKGMRNSLLGLYGFVGLGGFYFNPKGRFGNQWIPLHPLSTEGQGLEGGPSNYSRLAIAIPVGFGIRKTISKSTKLGIELGVRKTFTDYIDDVSTTYFDNDIIRQEVGVDAAFLADPSLGTINSTEAGMQRGDPTDMDSYVFLMVTFSHQIKKKSRFRRRVRSRRSMPSF